MDYLARLSQPSPMELARMGDFRAIAHWLNVSLMPQGIYARVAADRPGVLLVLLEFFRRPRQGVLNRLVCHRLCRLNSPVIRGVRILGRFADSAEILWDTSIRLMTPALRQGALPPSRRRSRSRRMRRSRHAFLATQPPSTRRPKPMLPQPKAQPKALPAQATPAPIAPVVRMKKRRRRSHSHLSLPRLSLPNVSVPNLSWPSVSVPQLSVSRLSLSQLTMPDLTPTQWRWLGQSAAALLLLAAGAEAWSRANADSLLGNLWHDKSTLRTASGRVPIIETNPPDAYNPTVTLTFTGASSGRHPLPTKATEQPDPVDPANPHPERIDPANLPEDWLNNAPEVVLQEGGSTFIKPWPTADVSLSHLNQPLPANLTIPETDSVKQPRPAAVNMVNVSGNAVAEGGTDGLLQTLETLDEYGLHPIGVGRNQRQARRPEIVEVRGKRIAYLGYSDSAETAAGRWRAGSNLALEARIAEDIQTIREQVDWVIVNYHWSDDLASYPEAWQRSLAHWAIDQGADLVVGYHPTALQGGEVYRGRAIAYSLGNFVFPNQPQNEQSTYDSAVLKVSLREDQMRLEFLPVAVTEDQPVIAQGAKAESIRSYLDQASALFEQPLQSPMILDRRESAQATPEADAKSVPTVQPDDSFIQYPDEAPDASPETPQSSDDRLESSESGEDWLKAPDAFVEPAEEPAIAPTEDPSDPTAEAIAPSPKALDTVPDVPPSDGQDATEDDPTQGDLW